MTTRLLLATLRRLALASRRARRDAIGDRSDRRQPSRRSRPPRRRRSRTQPDAGAAARAPARAKPSSAGARKAEARALAAENESREAARGGTGAPGGAARRRSGSQEAAAARRQRRRRPQQRAAARNAAAQATSGDAAREERSRRARGGGEGSRGSARGGGEGSRGAGSGGAGSWRRREAARAKQRRGKRRQGKRRHGKRRRREAAAKEAAAREAAAREAREAREAAQGSGGARAAVAAPGKRRTRSARRARRIRHGVPRLHRLPGAGLAAAGRIRHGRSIAASGPRPMVAIDYPLAVGRFEVTFAEWDACVAAGGCRRRPHDAGWGRGWQPVINVSWADAQQYVAWLSRRTGKRYRLLTEAEWEYAARAGTDARYWWGNHAGRGDANCADCGSKWDGRQAAPVGRFAPNPFGLLRHARQRRRSGSRTATTTATAMRRATAGRGRTIAARCRHAHRARRRLARLRALDALHVPHLRGVRLLRQPHRLPRRADGLAHGPRLPAAQDPRRGDRSSAASSRASGPAPRAPRARCSTPGRRTIVDCAHVRVERLDTHPVLFSKVFKEFEDRKGQKYDYRYWAERENYFLREFLKKQNEFTHVVQARHLISENDAAKQVLTCDAGITVANWLRVKARYADTATLSHPFQRSDAFLRLMRGLPGGAQADPRAPHRPLRHQGRQHLHSVCAASVPRRAAQDPPRVRASSSSSTSRSRSRTRSRSRRSW